MKIQPKKALKGDFDSVLFCVLTKLKHAKIVVFKITSKCSNVLTKLKHAKIVVSKITSEVLKRLRNICGHFRQR